MNKKTIKLICIIGVVIIALIGFENILRGLSKVTEDIKTNSELKKEQKEYEKSEEYIIDTYLDKCIQKTVDYLNSGDYDSIYALLDPEYKAYMNFTSIEAFEEYMLNYIGNPKSVTLMSHFRNNNKYVCKISVLNDLGLRTYTVLVTPLGEESFTVIFDNISYIKSLDRYYSYSDKEFIAHLTYKVRYTDHLVYAVDITNNTSSTVSGSLAESFLLKSNKVKYYPINDKEDLNVVIEPNETVRVKLQINDSGVSYYEDQHVNVILKDAAGNVVLDGKIITAENYWE